MEITSGILMRARTPHTRMECYLNKNPQVPAKCGRGPALQEPPPLHAIQLSQYN